jgi:TP901 family phage tail tape measure protein
MSKFVLTAQLQLQAPTNVAQVTKQIQNQLSNVNVNIQAKGAAQTTRQVQNLTKAVQQADSAAFKLGKTFTTSLKRFAAFSVATRAVSVFTQGIGGALDEAIKFERELIKVAQVTGKTVAQLSNLTNEIKSLATNLGVSSSELLNVSRALSQAGFSARETKVALDALAKSSLAPTFEDMAKTAEGAIAIFNQFGKGAAALEGQLGAINAVAGQFAVEAGDLISVIRRTGGVFKAAGGDLNELIALFTSVRATTRESAESIATGLRTIFTRIQRPRTIKFLEGLGVSLVDLEGKFVGPFEAIKRLSEALGGLEAGDLRFVRIAEELGGFRQIGKVIPLLNQFGVAQEAYNAALGGANSLTKDAETAQQSLAVQLQKLREQWLATVRSITESTGFKIAIEAALSLASAVLNIADALKSVLPLLAAFGAMKIAKGMGGFLAGAKAGAGAAVPKFASGGMVPGTGSRDTVPAMLTPGEFVIRKSSVQKMGAKNLQNINAKGYAEGGPVKGYDFKLKAGKVGGFFLRPEKGSDTGSNSTISPSTKSVPSAALTPDTINALTNKYKNLPKPVVESEKIADPSQLIGKSAKQQRAILQSAGVNLSSTQGLVVKQDSEGYPIVNTKTLKGVKNEELAYNQIDSALGTGMDFQKS